MTTNQLVHLRIDGPCAEVILARPEARNAVNLKMCEELVEVFDRIAANAELRVVVLRAEGPVFCAGADMKERSGKDEAWVMARRRASFRAYDKIAACSVPVICAVQNRPRSYHRRGRMRAYDKIAACSVPVICAVQGALVGSGGEIAMSCDFIIAADDATFLFPEAGWGTVGATQRLQRVIGVSRAKELLFTGRKMDADEAERLGLVARLVPPADLGAEVSSVVERILAAPGLAMRLTKQCVDQGSRTDLASGIAIELAAIERNLMASDWRAEVGRFANIVGNEKEAKR